MNNKDEKPNMDEHTLFQRGKGFESDPRTVRKRRNPKIGVEIDIPYLDTSANAEEVIREWLKEEE